MSTHTPAGGPIHVREVGRGTPVVLIHGNFASSAWWKPVMDHRRPGWWLIAPDLPGCGRSAAPATREGYALDRVAAGLSAAVDVLRVGDFHLVGHSLGAAVALCLALAHPARVKTLTLVAPAPLDGIAGLRRGRNRLGWSLRMWNPRSPARMRWLEASMHGARALGTYRRHVETAVADQLSPSRVDRRTFQALANGAVRQSSTATIGYLQALAAFDLRAKVARLGVETSIIWGAEDRVVPRESVDEMAAALANATLDVWAGFGHALQVEDPGRFVAHLDRVIMRREPRLRLRRCLERLTPVRRARGALSGAGPES